MVVGIPRHTGKIGTPHMKEEMDALVEKDTLEFVDCPKNVKVINNCWVLLMKLNADVLTKQFYANLLLKFLHACSSDL
jgi:hypothetical protein